MDVECIRFGLYLLLYHLAPTDQLDQVLALVDHPDHPDHLALADRPAYLAPAPYNTSSIECSHDLGTSPRIPFPSANQKHRIMISCWDWSIFRICSIEHSSYQAQDMHLLSPNPHPCNCQSTSTYPCTVSFAPWQQLSSKQLLFQYKTFSLILNYNEILINIEY